MVPFSGWEMPLQFSGIVDEHHAVRRAAGLFDASHMGELELSGRYAGAVVNYLVTNDVTRLSDGQALYTCACNESGRVLDDLIVYRCSEERYLIVCNASNRQKMAEVFAQAADHHCDFADRSDKTALLALQGPRAFEVLARAGGEASQLGSLRSFAFRDAVVCNVHATVARTGYTGEDGVEIFCAWDDAPALAMQLFELGRDLGLKPAGLGARDTLRLEARLSLYGQEIDETIHPLEAGLGWVVKFDKGDFVGRAALEALKHQPPTRTLIGFEMVGRGIARPGYPLLTLDGQPAGVCTSGGPAPTLGKNIGLGFVPPAMAPVGTRFAVDCRGKSIEAVVTKTPFYKRTGAQK
jgi:aminomethyltransferase